ncbi:MAG TPA: O-methyltransferase [Candidatus Kapabacteria bacterium]|nr:O-methyltransferase [Candidatus Kapabacteria bacterium]
MKGTPLTEQTFDYIVDNFAFEESMMLELMQQRASEAGMPMIMISEEQAKFLGFFVKAIGAKRVLDVGTLFGYSAAVMAKAIGAGGEIITLEFEPLHSSVARANFKHLGLENISSLVGPALDHMKTMPDNYYDFILIDADKINYVNYLKESLRIIKNGGVIAGDNALAWGKIADVISESDPDYTSVTSIQKFNKEMASLKNAFTCVVPIGDGMAMAFVTK